MQAVAAPERLGGKCRAQGPQRQRRDGSGLLGEGDERLRGQRTESSVPPAHQSLDAGKSRLGDVHLGLVHEIELAGGDCGFDVGRERRRWCRAARRFAAEDSRACVGAARSFGSHAGTAHQRQAVLAMVRKHSDARSGA